MTAVSAATLPVFEAWLRERRPLGIALNAAGNAAAVADLTSQRTVDLTDTALTRAVVSLLLSSGRKAWAMDHAVVHILRKATTYPLEHFSWINDLAIAHHSAHPGEPLPEPARGAARRARQSAALIKALAPLIPISARPSMNAAIDLDKAFRVSQARGVRIDVQGLGVAISDNRRVTAAAAIEDGVDLTRVYADTDKAAATAWLAWRGITVTDYEGAPSLSRDHFDRAEIPDSPEARYVWSRFRAAASRRSARMSLDQIANNLHDDGHVYPDIHLRGAKTGRGTVTGPNLTSLSKAYRHLIIAEPGCTFLALDLDRAEPTVAAALSGDMMLQRALATGDVYRELAVAVFGETAREDDPARATCKTAFLGILYGRGAQGLAQQLGIAKAEAQRVIDGIWAAYPVLANYCGEMRAAAKAGTRVRTPSGRLLPVPNRGAYQMPNFVLQGTTSDVFYAGLARVAASIGVDVLVLPIHDEILIQVKPDEVFRTAVALETAMTVEINGLTVTGSTKILGGSWGR